MKRAGQPARFSYWDGTKLCSGKLGPGWGHPSNRWQIDIGRLGWRHSRIGWLYL